MAKNTETTTKFKVDISELKSGLRDANRAIALTNSEFKNATAGMEKWSDSADGINAKITQLKSVNKSYEKILEDVSKKYNEIVEAEGEESESAQNLKIKMNNLEAAIKGNEAAIGKYEDSLNDLTGVSDDVEGSVNDIADSIEDADDAASDSASGGISAFKVALGNLAADGISAVVGALKDMVTELANAEGAYDNFQIQTGLSTAEMEKFQAQIDEIYKSGAGESIEDISSAMAMVVQNTNELDPSKIKELTENALTLRDSFGFDIQESMRAVNMLIDQFGITGEEAFNLIVQGAQNGLDKNGDLLDSINEYAVHYKQLGYDADDFFNSLANGTEAGTFSVDKLGDAMKEFGIRTKDTATTTIEGFELLGYGASASAEEISKTKDEISKLEKNLKYAKMEQEGFNDKTSELTRLKNADKIEEYSKALESAKDKLANLTKESDNSRGSIQTLQDKFAEGGEAAQEATQEVLEALFEMDDKVKQNQAGVDLFGTMWEDLGAEGVKALMDTNGELTTSKKSMEEIKKIKYDNVVNDISAIGRTFKMDVVAPIVDKAMPKIKSGLEWITENLDGLIDIAKPLGVALAGVFVVNKVATFAGSIKTLVGVVGKLTTATKVQAGAQTALNATNPFGWVTLAVGAIGGLIAIIQDSIPTYDEMVEKYAELDEEEQALRDTTNGLIDSYKSFNSAKNETISNTSAEFGYYDTLWNELQGIVDQNGKVKQGYEDRAAVITGILSEALGTEITITDGVVQKYGELKKSIDDVIVSKKAEAMLTALENEYTTAIQNKNDALVTYRDNQALLKTQTEDLSVAEQEYNEIQAEMNRLYALQKEYIDSGGEAIGGYNSQIVKLAPELDEAKAKFEGLSEKVDAQTSVTKESEDAYLGYIGTIENYEGVSAAIISGDTDKINDSLLLLEHGFVSAETGTKKSLENQTANYKKELTNLQQAIKDKTPGVTQEQAAQMQKLVNMSEAELAKLEPKAEKQMDNTMTSIVQSVKNGETPVFNAASDVAGKTEEGLKNGDPVTAGGWWTGGFAQGILSKQSEVENAANTIGSLVDGVMQRLWQFGSPSKVMKKKGRWLTEGLAIGITDSVQDVVKSVKSVSNAAMSTLKTNIDVVPDLSNVSGQINGTAAKTGGSNSVINNYTFNQTNNSPKALSRFDIYRQSKNLLNAKGV